MFLVMFNRSLIVGGVLVAGLTVGGCSHMAAHGLMSGPSVGNGTSVLFRYYDPTARRVQLAGSWPENNWARGDGTVGEANIGLMEDADGDGVWQISVTLEPGRYKYLFWVDELTWHVDPGNPEEIEGGPARVCSQIVVYGNDGKIELR